MRRIALTGIVLAVLLSGSARADQPALRLSNLNFGNQPIGSSTEGMVTIKNVSDHPVQITAISLPSQTGGFELGQIHCLQVLQPTESCAESVIFAPTRQGVFSARLDVEGLNHTIATIVRGHAN